MVKQPSTQEHLPIAGIQDDVLLMNDGSVRAVIKVEPINFELKSEDEQNAIIYSYQGFLNSLEFPIQIVFQSKRLDLSPYLSRLEETARQQGSELLQEQAEDYIGFVRRLVSVAKIMAKRFYVVVSHSHISKSSFSLLNRRPTGPLMDQAEFDRLRGEVFNKGLMIADGLGRIGCKTQPLTTQELIELFYNIYNPDVASEERLIDTGTLSAGIVTSPQASALAETFAPAVPKTEAVPVPPDQIPGASDSEVVAEVPLATPAQPEPPMPPNQ